MIKTDLTRQGHAIVNSDVLPQWVFALAMSGGGLFASGLKERLPTGVADELEGRVTAFFQRQREDERYKDAGHGKAVPYLVGAIPFDRQADDCLFQPESLAHAPWEWLNRKGCPVYPRSVTGEPDRAAYCEAVRQALHHIRQSHMEGVEDAQIEKIVLSRSLLLEAESNINPAALWARLEADPAAARFMTTLADQADGRARYLVGATPELLVSKQQEVIVSHPLAGSARRSADAVEDRAVAEGLVRSAKDLREHRWVVEAIMDALSPYCRDLRVPERPALVSTCTMWHLGTRIEGILKDPHELSSAGLAALLHPTPAVGGYPRKESCALIRDLEGYDRGFYAGALGWTNSDGDGEWYVSLRCAQISGNQARIYAGAGIVEGSDPEAEAEETSAKLQAILRAFGIDETGRPLGGH